MENESVLLNGQMCSEDELDLCMKANEAPEKIYLNPIQDALTEMLGTKVKGDIEYTRTDAFIDKAVDYIANNMRCDGYTLQTKAKFIKEFKNHMKVE